MSVPATHSLATWKDEPVERAILDQVSLDTAWPVLETFATLVRSSGSAE